VDHALKYAATDIDSLINLHNRIYSQVLSWLPWSGRDIPELTRVIPNLAAYMLDWSRQVSQMLTNEIAPAVKN